MAEQISALLVHGKDETFHNLAQVLKLLSMKVIHAGNCREAFRLLKGKDGVDLVFAGTDLPDGSWADVLGAAQQSRNYLPVIVVSQVVDIGLYMESLGKGAFDFVTPPFLTSDLAQIVRSAIYKELLSVKQDWICPPTA